MQCKDLKVVNLNITEDNYEYKALFRLCKEDVCMDLDVSTLSEDSTIMEIKNTFEVEEDVDAIRKVINEKIMEASQLESRIKEGKDYGNDSGDNKQQRDIDSLNMA